MFKPPGRCPDKSCDNHISPRAGFLRKRGTYSGSDGRTVQRYQCKDCGRTFTNRTEAPARLQRAEGINQRLFGMVCSGITMRRAANRLRTAHALFDEMDTFMHSRAKNLTIAVIVRAKTGEILAAQTDRIASRMPASPAVAGGVWKKDIACMARDTWATTKSIKELQDKLDIYIAWNNRYWIR
jgi:transposase-like protein